MNTYYEDRFVQQRIVEFLGGDAPENATAVFTTTTDHSFAPRYEARPVGYLWKYLKFGWDVNRSLWDREHLLAHLDIDYVNFDFPGEHHFRPQRCFDLQRPVVRAIQEVLLEHGIGPLHLLSGRGHHFVWQIPRGSDTFEELAAIGHVPAPLAGRYAQPHPPHGETVPPQLGAAHAGLGLVMELVTHRVLEISRPSCDIPVEPTAVLVSPGVHGREMISVDISEYGDPLHQRSIRIPFSVYRKPHEHRGMLGERVIVENLPMFLVPLHEMDEHQGLLVMRDIGEVAGLARVASSRIPEQPAGMQRLVTAYRASDLARFHRHFYSAEHDDPREWPRTYDRTPAEKLPGCAKFMLEHPNDALLKPAGIRHVVRVLLAGGWHPRHIAGLVRSRYERNYGWGDRWYHDDAAGRADFYCRLFSGLIATGLDDLSDFNCREIQDKGLCRKENCDERLDSLNTEPAEVLSNV